MMAQRREGRFFDRQEEVSSSEREERQGERLAGMVRLGYRKSKRVKDTLDRLKIDPGEIRSIRDLERLP